jgi:selenocysteine lyase/cysteine desulfurase
LGLDVTTPEDPSARAGNICFRHANPEGLMRRAASDGLFIWGDNGRVRISTHLFNDNDDLQALFDRLPIYLREEGC